MNGRRSRELRRQQRERREALERGAKPTLEEKIVRANVETTGRLAELNAEYVRERAELDAAYKQSKAAVLDDNKKHIQALKLAAREEGLGIVIAPASTDLAAVDDEIARLTGKRRLGIA